LHLFCEFIIGDSTSEP